MILSSKRLIMFIALFVILGGALMWGLGQVAPTRVSAPSLRAESSEGPLKLVVTLDKTTYAIGERINLTIQIVNISNSTIELLYGTPIVMPPIRFNVSDAQGKGIYTSGTFVATMDVTSKYVTLEPSHIFGEIRDWRQWDNNMEELSYNLEQVAPGEYHIVVEIIPNALFVFKYINGTKVAIGTIYMKTSPLTITIST